MEMNFLSIHFILIFLLPSSHTLESSNSVPGDKLENGSVLYCDGIFQLLNRTDESDQHCNGLDFEPYVLKEHLASNDSNCEGGLTCGGECVSFGDWCVKGTAKPTKCGYHLQDPEICRNTTFWKDQECPETSAGRCTGWWPGQCEGDYGCRDQSDHSNVYEYEYEYDENDISIKTNNDNDTCPYKDKIINITQEFMTCQDKYNSLLLICAKRCDRVNDGCVDDLDEKDCVPVISNITMGVAVIVLILVTIVSAEVTLCVVKGNALGKDKKIENEDSTELKEKIENNESIESKNEESIKKEESREVKNKKSKETKNKQIAETKINIKDFEKNKMHKWVLFKPETPPEDTKILEEVAGHMDNLFDMILDKDNWVFGQLHFSKCSNFTAPHWSTGDDIGFKQEKMDTLKILYNNFRKLIPGCQSFIERKCECPRCMCFRFFLYAIPHKSRENPKKQFEKLPHYVFELIYTKLEVEFLKENPSHTQDIDISIKYALGNRNSGTFYGHVYPYLHIPSLLLKMLSFIGVWIENIEIFIAHIPYINYISYLIAIILAIAGFYVDFMKDVLIANHVSFLYTTFWDFKSQVVLLLWATIFVNQTLIGLMIVFRGPTQLFHMKVDAAWKKLLIRFIFLIMSPISPTLLLYMNARATVRIKRMEKQLKKELIVFHPPQIYYTAMDNLEMYHRREHMIAGKRRMESVIATSYKIGILYENTPQILLQVLIVLLSVSAVTLPEMTGIEAIWDTREGGSNIASKLFFFSIIWSLIGITSSLVSTFFYHKENSIGDLGKILIYLQMFICTSVRLMCIILYMAPFLGLFSILLHYQIEQTIEYSDDVLKIMDPEFIPKHDIGWYLLMNRGYALVLFFFFPLAHAIVVIIYKSKYVHNFVPAKGGPDSLSSKTHTEYTVPLPLLIYRRLLHAFSSLLSPDIWSDWDFLLKSNKQDYQNLCRKAMLEYYHMCIIFFIENILLLVPLIYTCCRVLQRHASIQFPLEEEEVIVTYCYAFLASPLIVLILSWLHFLIFLVYNIKGHPWSILLDNKIQIWSLWCDLLRCRVESPPVKKDP